MAVSANSTPILKVGNIGHTINYYMGPIDIHTTHGFPKVAIQLPYKYLDFANPTIRLGRYTDYIWAREERLKNNKGKQNV